MIHLREDGRAQACASPPLVIMSFDRPAYLRLVLESLVSNGIARREVHLFQDGAVSRDRRAGDDGEIAACVASFRALVPHGTVHWAPHNLGIAANFRRAEWHMFRDLGHEVAYFFEDDMVLSPHYLAMLDTVTVWAMRTPRIAYWAAYGSQSASLKKQEARRNALQRQTMHWAFAVKRAAWVKIDAFLDAYYYPHIDGIDYRIRRDQRDAVFNGMELLGVLPPVISHDAMKGLAMHVAGFTKANTFACFARYIGEAGEHSNPTRFRNKGYGSTTLYPEPVTPSFPSSEEIGRWIVDSQQRYEAVWRSVFAPGEGELPYRLQRRLSNERLNLGSIPSRRSRRFGLF